MKMIILLLFTLTVNAQKINGKTVPWQYLPLTDSVIRLRTFCGIPKITGKVNELVYDSCNDKLYFYDKKWLEIKKQIN